VLRAAVPLALLAVGCGRHGDSPDATEAVPLVAPVAAVERISAELRTEIAGTVAATRDSAVSSRVMAMVTAVHVDMGDEVDAGAPLLSIDPVAVEGQVSQARGALVQAEAALALARRNHERYLALAASDSASQLEVDLARSQLDQAQGAVVQARGAVQAASAVARESRVVAPFAGRVVSRLVEVGDLASPGRALVMLESHAGRRLVLAVPESLLERAALGPGAALPVRLDARPDLGEITGRVAALSPGPDPATHAYTVELDLPVDGVAAGAAGRAYLSLGRREGVVVAPPEAIIESGGLTLVVVRDAGGRAQSRVVTLGEHRADGRIEVLSGLSGGETVVTGLAVAPPAGTPIEVTP
jgi:RND family efflux transporter MFP subunit